jgi:hypothetical protein
MNGVLEERRQKPDHRSVLGALGQTRFGCPGAQLLFQCLRKACDLASAFVKPPQQFDEQPLAHQGGFCPFTDMRGYLVQDEHVQRVHHAGERMVASVLHRDRT